MGRSLPEIRSIQVLRAVAALMVFGGHLGAEIGQNSIVAVPGWSGIGAAGVDLFFVISGFIMVYVSRDLFGRPEAPLQFLQRRLIRIVPLYWLVSGVLLAHALLRYDAAALAAADLSPAHISASFLFIPWPRPSGDIEPLLRPGWTLNYEMMFYLIFAASISLPRRQAVSVTAAALVAIMITVGLATSWPSSIAVEFIYGMAIALLQERLKISRTGALILIGCGFAAFCSRCRHAGAIPFAHSVLGYSGDHDRCRRNLATFPADASWLGAADFAGQCLLRALLDPSLHDDPADHGATHF